MGCSYERETKKEGSHRQSFAKIGIVGFVIASIIIIILAVLGPKYGAYRMGGIGIRTADAENTDSELQGYIQSLRVNPQTLPTGREYELSWFHDTDLHRLCINLRYSEAIGDLENHSQVWINDSLIWGELKRELGLRASSDYEFTTYCTDSSQLNSGWHLLEIRLKTARFAEPIYVHQWAIEIEN